MRDGLAASCLAEVIANTVSLALGNGNATFAPATSYAVGTAPVSVAVGDLNRDGRLDRSALSAELYLGGEPFPAADAAGTKVGDRAGALTVQ